MPLTRDGSFRITDEQLQRLVLTPDQVLTLLPKNKKAIAAVVRHSLTEEDVVAVAYRKRQLEVFRKLLEDSAFFDRMAIKRQCTAEALWQKFFEHNPWIFGYGLQYIYVSGWNSEKLEQVVSGSMIFKPGKRADALMRSRGVLSNLCFVEIKRRPSRAAARSVRTWM
jgi:hypothetical protein